MTTQEMYDKGYRCRGRGFNCNGCSQRGSCVEIEPPTKKVNIKNKSCRIKEEPIGTAFVVTNDKFSFFRAYKGQPLGHSSKKYVAYIHEIVEEL